MSALDRSHRPTRPRRRSAFRGAVAILVAAIIAQTALACGSPAPTSPAATASPTAESSPTAAPTPPIVPVPTPRLAAAGSPAARLDPATEAALQKALDDARTSPKQQLPGIAAAVLFPDGSIWTGQSGVAVISTSKPLTADTLFSVGSISKTFVAALTLRLARRGTIKLSDPLSRYVPSFPNSANITLRQLLNHTSGIRDIFSSTDMAEDVLAEPEKVWTTAEVLDRVGKPYFLPGRGYHYSNTNYILLGLAIERATHKSLASLIRQEFLAPLGLSHTYLQTQEQAKGTLAHGYMGSAVKPRDISAGSTMVPFNAEASVAGASGAYVSNAGDLAVWAAALYGGGVLDDVDMAYMVDVSSSLPYKPSFPYGFGFELCLIGGRLSWGHRGYLDGFWSAMEYLPDSRIVVVTLTNADWADPLAPSDAIVTALLGPAPKPSPTPTPTSSSSSSPNPSASPTAPAGS